MIVGALLAAAAVVAVPLHPGAPLARTIAAGETASFTIAIPAETAGVITVVQQGVDVEIRLADPVSGATLQSSESANGVEASEILVTPISRAPSSWTIEVKPVLPRAVSGGYTMAMATAPADAEATLRAALRQRFHDANVRDRSDGGLLARSAEELLAVASEAAAVDPTLVPEALYQAGLVIDLLDDSPRAIATLERALPLYRALGLRGRESRALDRLGDLARKTGEVTAAERYLAEALPIARAVGDPETEADILNNTGLLLSSVGRKDEAITMLSAAIPLAQEVESLDVEAALHHNIGQAYWHLGDAVRSLEAYERAMVVKRKMGSPRRSANTLNAMAGVWFAVGDAPKALATVNEALALWKVSGSKPGLARSTATLGQIQHANGDLDAAAASFAAAAPLLRDVRDRAGEGGVLASWAEIDLTRGDPAAALERLDDALALTRSAADRRGEARVLYLRARALREAGRLSAAIDAIAAAIELVEASRATIVRADLRSSYLSTVRRYYDLYIELLLARDGDATNASESFRVSERARARALLEGLAESGARIRKGIDPRLAERERAIHADLNAHVAYRAQRAGSGRPEEIEAIDREIAALIESWRILEAEIRRSSPAYAALTMPQPATAPAVQTSLLDSDTALVEYHLGAARSHAWVIDGDGITVHDLPPADEIERLAREWHSLLSAQRAGLPPAERERLARALDASGVRLAGAVIEPLAARLGSRRLLVVPDGALHYVPFAAVPLPGTGEPLLARHEIAYLPSASVLATLRSHGERERATTVAVFADPVFSSDDPRLTGRAQSAARNAPVTRDEQRRLPNGFLPRLRFSRREAEAIALAAKDATFEALDFDASKETLAATPLRDYPIIHFATHGALDTEHPELSGLVLSLFDSKGRKRDGFLRLHEIYNLDLDAELVVLSACETALGKEVHGEGLIGITRGFMYAGAERVISSIWKIDDRASARLMASFYERLLETGASPAAALRDAQLAMWREARWRDPHYWAAFGLYGEWK
jgi:CHAT domain-containing protein/tetratricopeptide (TPR) repeat protein